MFAASALLTTSLPGRSAAPAPAAGPHVGYPDEEALRLPGFTVAEYVPGRSPDPPFCDCVAAALARFRVIVETAEKKQPGGFPPGGEEILSFFRDRAEAMLTAVARLDTAGWLMQPDGRY
jgi:hypothetical protein